MDKYTLMWLKHYMISFHANTHNTYEYSVSSFGYNDIYGYVGIWVYGYMDMCIIVKDIRIKKFRFSLYS